MNRVWDEAVKANPSLFDGPVAACTRLDWEAPGCMVLSWTGVTYRHYALRRVPEARAAALPSLFVTVVQPTDEGALLVGQMSASTAAPGRWQLPGGSVEPPEGREVLDEAALRRHAARELAEETGVNTAPDDLTLWVVTRGGNGSIGVFYRAPSRPASVLRERFSALVSAEQTRGRDPEFREVALVRSPADLSDLAGPQVDYLGPVVRRFAEALIHPGA